MRSKKAIINIISSVFLQVISIICGFIIPRLIISTYGSNVNGLVTSITYFLGFITLLEAGFGPVIKSILYKPIAQQDKVTVEKILKASEKIFKSIAIIFIIYIIFLCVFFPIVTKSEVDSAFTISLIIIISISIFAEYFWGMTYKLYLQAKQEKYVVSIIEIGTMVINTLVICILVKCGTNIQIVKLCSALIFVLRPILQRFYVSKKYKINLKNTTEKYHINNKWEGLAQHIAYVIHNNTDVAILTICGKLAEVSVYSVYTIIINGLKSIVQSFVSGLDALFGDMIAKNETENLNKSFRIYEGFYFTLSTIIFSSTLFLIVPFVKLYTSGITDANYIRYDFAYLMVLAKFVVIIRQPYNDLVKVAGHFKQTQKGAWIEAFSNVIISMVLVWKFGIVGVAIGTLFAVFVRTIEFMLYTAKNILHRSVWETLRKFCVIFLEIAIVYILVRLLPKIEMLSYVDWVINGICVFGISLVVVCIINGYVYRENFKLIKKYILQKNKKV